MQMLEPDFWKGRGRYSKQAISRKVVDEGLIQLPENHLIDELKK